MKTVLVVEPVIGDADTFVKPRHVDAVVADLAAFLRDVAI
jgi:hypothetical protein